MSKNHKKLTKKIGWKKHRIVKKNHVVFLIKRDGCKCGYCFREINKHHLTIDHIVPLAQGGSDSLVNKILCCRKCNELKGDMTVDEWLEYLGWEDG